MIHLLVTEAIYGGKIDDEHDMRLLGRLVRAVLTPAAFEIGHKLLVLPAATADEDGGSAAAAATGGAEAGAAIGNDECLTVPPGTSLHEFQAWIHRLPEREPPTFLGLPANAEKLLMVGLGTSLVGNLKKVTELLDEGERLVTEA